MKNTPHAPFEEVEYALYTPATLLAEALSTFGSADTIKAYDSSFKPVKDDPLMVAAKKPKSAAVLIALSESGSGVEGIDATQQKFLEELQQQVIDLVKKGDLIVAGFKMPRESTDLAVTIPADMFVSGNINWNKSEMYVDDSIFSAVKLLETEKQKVKVNKFHRAGTLDDEASKSVKVDFTKLKPEHVVIEKEAAKYLGISPRALQAYRKNGGGPEFIKQGQSIRYKMSDMIAWMAATKK